MSNASSSHIPRAVLITGGAQRVGRAMALGFARAGYDVAVHFQRSRREAESLSKEIANMGRTSVTLQANLAEPEDCAQLIAQAFAALPHLCVLINNASSFPAATLNDTSPELLQEMMALHVQAPLLLSRAFGARQPECRIVNMVDTNIHFTHQKHFAYLVSKKALADLTAMLARGLAPAARVNGICPGAVLPDAGTGEDYLQALAAKLPLQRIAAIQDIVDTALFLAEPRSITGQLIMVDSGEHLL